MPRRQRRGACHSAEPHTAWGSWHISLVLVISPVGGAPGKKVFHMAEETVQVSAL